MNVEETTAQIRRGIARAGTAAERLQRVEQQARAALEGARIVTEGSTHPKVPEALARFAAAASEARIAARRLAAGSQAAGEYVDLIE